MSGLLLSLALSLLLTLVLELVFALLWRVGRRDLPLVALANVLTNPVVVFCHAAAAAFAPGLLVPITAALELSAVFAEGWLFKTRSDIRAPWLFAVGANLFSFVVGLFL